MVVGESGLGKSTLVSVLKVFFKLSKKYVLASIFQVNSMFLTDIYNSTTEDCLESNQTLEVLLTINISMP